MIPRVRFHLRRRPVAEPATAVLLLHNDAETPSAAPALELCARVGLDPSGRVFAVAGGLLVKLESPLRHAATGGIRLRGIARDLLVPVDADLVPALLDDEAAGLARDRGLVVLPSGRVLAYDPRSPLNASSLLIARRATPRSWESPPEPGFLAETIAEFLIEGPGGGGPGGADIEEAADRALDPGDPTLGTEEPRPDPAGLGKEAAGQAALGAGKGLMWLGGALGLSGLQGLGERLVRGAIGMVPRLSESVLGRQAASLRELLRDFEMGNIERALRRALPLNDPPTRGSQAVAGGGLPENDTSYRLDRLLRGEPGGGPTGVWQTEPDIRERLAREYRRAAAEALERGDSRRAAYIYGRLLGDFRSAANALQRGGLHRDAAAIFLARLHDKRSAALAYEAAGDFDRAVALHREMNEFEAAGDLLRKVGQEADAVAAYLRAAQILAETRNEYALGGSLLLDKAGRPDLAEIQFRAGWASRSAVQSRTCALRLAGLLARTGRGDDLKVFVAEAIARFRLPASDPAAVTLLHEFARFAAEPAVADVRDDVRDAIRSSLAERLRRHAEEGRLPPATLSAAILGGSESWTPPAVRDAQFALTSAIARHQRPAALRKAAAIAPFGLTASGTGGVTAVVSSWGSEEIFLGFAGGEIFAYRPATSELVPINGPGPEVASLAVSADGRSVAALCRSDDASTPSLSTYQRGPDGGYRFAVETTVGTGGDLWLTPIVSTVRGDIFGIWDGWVLSIVELANLTWRPGHYAGDGTLAAFLVPDPVGGRPRVLALQGPNWAVLEPRPSREPESTPLCPAFFHPGHAEFRPGPPRMTATVAGGSELGVFLLGESGGFSWRLFDIRASTVEARDGGTSGRRFGYRTGAILNPTLAVALTETHIDWFTLGASGTAVLRSTTDCAFAGVMAVFPNRRAGELIVMSDRGVIRRLSASPPSRSREP